MSESGGVNASSLAVVEKKPQRSGGCVGIFFQLIDWNRRFAKKKLFSKKLLPPARAKQAAKKFGGDEKQPKLRLIADENSGGFPNLKKNGASNVDSEQRNGVRTPSLVARLMGLESMPTAQQDKLKKASSSGIKGDKREKFTSEFVRENQEFEKGGTKHEVRPPKLQKTGLLERHPVTRFGTETLHLKNILSRSRKQHHPKLASPVKSPRNLSGRNASRLMGAATKILEPGLQARNRVKSALTYSHNICHGPINEFMSESMMPLSPENSNHYMNEVKSLKGQSSCKNCGNLLDVVHSRPNIEDQPSIFVSPPSHMSEMSKPRIPISFLEQESERDFQKRQEHSASFARAVGNIRHRADFISDRMMPLDRGQAQWHLTNQNSKPQTSPTSINYKQKPQKQNEVRPNYQQNNRFMPATNAVSQTKDFVALNRSLSGRTRSKVPAKVDDLKFDSGRKYANKRKDSLSPARKRRSMNASRLGESSRIVNSTIDKPRIIGGSGNKDNEAITFTFSSPMKHRSEVPSKGVRRDQTVSPCKSTPHKSLPNETDGKTCFQKPFPLTGDTLGALLDQKLKELTTQEEDESALGSGIQPKRTSTMILQELIFALTAERRPPQCDMDCGPNAKPDSEYCGRALNSRTNLCFQSKPKATGASFRHMCDNDHLSPGCVLEASFSNESCFSSSLDDSSGHILHDSTSCSCDEPQHLNPESDDFYSGTSLTKERSGRDLVIELLNYMSEVLYNIDLSEARLKGNKVNHAKEVIFNAELVLGNAAIHTSHEIKGFSISSFLLDELETLASVLWTNFSNFLGFEDTKEGNQFRGFIFDCLIEYLDSSYGRFSKSGFRAWTSLPFCMNAEKMIHEVAEEVRGWMSLVGLIPDDLIEREMSRGLGKWTDFEIEAFETGVEINRVIFYSLLDEIVVDLLECNLGFGISCSPC